MNLFWIFKQSNEKDYFETNDNSETKRPVTHPCVKYNSLERIKFIQRHLNLNKIKTALDVGGGSGFSSHYMPVDSVSVDLSSRLIKLNTNKSKIQGSAYELPFRDDSFDLVYGWDFLHHIHEPQKVVDEMLRVSKKNLILLEPNNKNPIIFLFGLINKNERLALQYSKSKLKQLTHGCKIIKHTSFGWAFSGVIPPFTIKIMKYLPIEHWFGNTTIIICEK